MAPDTSDSAPPAAIWSVPCDVVVRVASSATDPAAIRVAPEAMLIVPWLASVAGRLMSTSPAFETRRTAPDAAAPPPPIVMAEALTAAPPEPSMTLPDRTSMLSVATSTSSGAFSSLALLLATMMLLAVGVMSSPAAVVLRTPPISRLASSLVRLPESICR